MPNSLGHISEPVNVGRFAVPESSLIDDASFVPDANVEIQAAFAMRL